jgi:putative DNA-invertase from lambdoid prophage Rac
LTVFGYVKVSTAGQALSEQKGTLKNSGASIILSEKYSGTTTARPQFAKLVEIIQPNDTLIVTKLEHFTRNIREALNLIADLLKEKIMIKILKLGTIDDTSIDRMIVLTLLLVAELERDMIIERI